MARGETSPLIQLMTLLVATAQLAASLSLPVMSDLQVMERQTDYIRVNWTVDDTNSTIDSYKIIVEDTSEKSLITYKGDNFIDVERTEAKVILHTPDKSYVICVQAILTEKAIATFDSHYIEKCVTASTIQNILTSSILGLCLIIFFFILCVIIGYISWRCTKSRLDAKSADYEKSNANGNGDIIPLTQIED